MPGDGSAYQEQSNSRAVTATGNLKFLQEMLINLYVVRNLLLNRPGSLFLLMRSLEQP